MKRDLSYLGIIFYLQMIIQQTSSCVADMYVFHPHTIFCYRGNKTLIWLNVISYLARAELNVGLFDRSTTRP